MAMLTRATKAGAEQEVEDILRKSVATVQKTILDVHAIFSQRSGGDCWLVESAHSSCTAMGRWRLAARDIKDLCTQWLNVLAPKIRFFSKHLLSAVGNTNTLAHIRGTLWALTHANCEWVSSAPEESTAGLAHADMQTVWTRAVAFTIDVSTFREDADVDGTVKPPSLDLWALFFSSIFAELAEALLKDSLLCIRRDVEHRLDSILLVITGGQGRLPVHGTSAYANPNPHRSRALMAHEILAASEAVVSLLTSEIRHLSEDAWSLTERGDEAAADALRTSFYLLCVDMAAGLANHFRLTLQEIHSCIRGAAKQECGIALDGGARELEDAVGRFADAALVIGRVAWMLSGRSGRPLQSALTCPSSFAQNLRGRVEQQQLEAAFVIADTNGDGIVDADEAAEALQAVSFGSCADHVLDPTSYSSLTITEFFLFATRLLEEQIPLDHLICCLDDVLVKSLAVWSEWALERPATLLAIGCDDLATLCCSPGMTDDLWRQTHGIWEDKTIELDRDDGDGVQETIHFPVMISPALLCYIEGVAAELSRILSTSDLIAASCVKKHTVNRQESARGGQSANHEHSRGTTPSQETTRRARSLAASRASSDLKKALVVLCDGLQAAASQACEAAHLQLLLDALFLQKWVSDNAAAPSMQSLVGTLSDLVDPINLQIYMPHLQTAASLCWSACHTSLSLLFEGEIATQHGTSASAASMTPGGAVGSLSSFVPLVTKVRRFEILPLPLDAVRLLPANGKTRMRRSQGQASSDSGAGGEDGADSSTQARGMHAGRQALAGLMDQVGSVGSVLSAQNVNVQSVLGAASLFLGGRTRRGDGEEVREF